MALIWKERLEGYILVLMMDAHGGDNYDKEADHDLRKFIEDAHLVDHFYEKFPEPTRMYTRGKKRLDWILFDPAFMRVIELI